MLDTVKLGIPLSQKQHSKLLKIAMQSSDPQWVLYHPKTKEIRFRRVRGLSNLYQPSYHRDLCWDITETFTPESSFLILELSLPKYFYGHNIRLLYEFVDTLRILKAELEKQLHCKFVDVLEWELFRADCCYAWNLETYDNAKAVLDSLKHLSYPRKKPHIYDTSISFVGRTYSLKFYLKYPEFRKHDVPELIKSKVPIDWIEHWEELARPVLRYEATLRRQYLTRQKIRTVGDLAKPNLSFELRGDWGDTPEEYGIGLHVLLADFALKHPFDNDVWTHLKDGITLVQPQEIYILSKFEKFPPSMMPFSMWSAIVCASKYESDFEAIHPTFGKIDSSNVIMYEASNSRSAIVRRNDSPNVILQRFLDKFLGENRGMQDVQQVKALLDEKYKPVKAARLLGFWLYVQRLGSEEAKQSYGRESYYTAKTDLKAAGVSLTEPPKAIVNSDGEILQSFRLEVPSPRAVNLVDDNRDSESVLNLNYRRALRRRQG